MIHETQLGPPRKYKDLPLKSQYLNKLNLSQWALSGLSASQWVQSRINKERRSPTCKNDVYDIRTNGRLIKYVHHLENHQKLMNDENNLTEFQLATNTKNHLRKQAKI